MRLIWPQERVFFGLNTLRDGYKDCDGNIEQLLVSKDFWLLKCIPSVLIVDSLKNSTEAYSPISMSLSE